MADAEAKNILDNLWASDALADREDPEDVGITRASGWPVAYEQIGSGKKPERTVFNQLLRELSGWASDRMTMGIGQWDEDVNYTHPAFATRAGGLYRTTENTGPAYGNPTDPSDTGQSTWRQY